MPRAEEKVIVRNIYYMMAYAFKALGLDEYASIETEEFEHVEDLLAAILSIGISSRLKRGLEHGYAEVSEDFLGIRGKIDMAGTSQLRSAGRRSIRCTSDEWTVNTQMNRVLKCAVGTLVRSGAVGTERKTYLEVIIGSSILSTIFDLPLSTGEGSPFTEETAVIAFLWESVMP